MEMNKQKYEVVIGLEVHTQLSTKTKIFCGCENIFGAEPNSRTCPVCLGLPGSLPVANKQALDYAIKIGLALGCDINTFVKFDRKNYFYPDCPKNYQISQFDFPICHHGQLVIQTENNEEKIIGITRAHLEEDAGKLIHDQEGNCTLVDYNRTGTPLLEIVSEPDLRSPQEAYDFLNKLKLTIRYLDVSDCDMEKGSLRCDANISIREYGAKEFGTKTELKNMNSFKAVKSALEYEINRQTAIVDAGQKVLQETLLWDEGKAMTVTMRSKEAAHDYRYFPEPDLVPFNIQNAYIENIRQSLPELPDEKLKRFQSDYQLSEYDAGILIQEINNADFFETCARKYKDYKKLANWLNGSMLQELKQRKQSINDISITPDKLTSLLNFVDQDVLSNLSAKETLTFMIDTGKSAEDIIEEKGFAQVSDDSELIKIVDSIIQENDAVIQQIKEGKDSAIGFLVGQGMKKSQGKANPKKIGELIKRRILDA